MTRDTFGNLQRAIESSRLGRKARQFTCLETAGGAIKQKSLSRRTLRRGSKSVVDKRTPKSADILRNVRVASGGVGFLTSPYGTPASWG